MAWDILDLYSEDNNNDAGTYLGLDVKRQSFRAQAMHNLPLQVSGSHQLLPKVFKELLPSVAGCIS